jgi:hypothetical protein
LLPYLYRVNSEGAFYNVLIFTGIAGPGFKRRRSHWRFYEVHSSLYSILAFGTDLKAGWSSDTQHRTVQRENLGVYEMNLRLIN